MKIIIDLIKSMLKNHDSNITYFNELVYAETKKYVEMWIEDDKIKIYHKVTGREIGLYEPSQKFIELANIIIDLGKPSIRVREMQKIKKSLTKYGLMVELDSNCNYILREYKSMQIYNY